MAIVGLGGLGHVGVQIAHAMGGHVTVLDLAEAKRADALRFGADAFEIVDGPETFAALANTFDLVVSTVPMNVDMDALLGLLDRDGTLVQLAIPAERLGLSAASLLANRRSPAGSRTGGISETQKMIDFCAAHGIAPQTELIDADPIDEAFARLEGGDARYRFVIDGTTFRAP